MSVYKRKLTIQLFLERLANPLIVLAYFGVWVVFVRLCQYGGVRKRLPALALCAVFFFGYFVYYLVSRERYLKRAVPKLVFTKAEVKEDGILFTCVQPEEIGGKRGNDAEKDVTEYRLHTEEIRKVRRTKKYLYFFLKGSRFLVLDKKTMSEYDLEFLQLNISCINPFRKINYRFIMYALLFVITIGGSMKVVQSAVDFNGRLAWVLLNLQQKRYIKLSEDNLYTSGLEGILADLDKTLALPEKLSVSTSFNLHFRQDGTIESFETLLAGYDSHSLYVRSYLITYDREKSKKITVYVQDNQTEEYNESKDFLMLVEMSRKIPFEETVRRLCSASEQEREAAEGEEFELLYYGERNFGYNTDGIIYLDKAGNTEIPLTPLEEIEGFTVSVFIPDKEEITPCRYLYCEDASKNVNITGVRSGETTEQSKTDWLEIKKREEEAEEKKEKERIENRQVKYTGTAYFRGSYTFPDVSVYGQETETKEVYSCPHDIKLCTISQTEYQLYGESEAIQKINECLKADREDFLKESLEKAEEIKQAKKNGRLEEGCICTEYKDMNGSYKQIYADYSIKWVTYLNPEMLEIYISRVKTDDSGFENRSGALVFNTKTGKLLTISETLEASGIEISEEELKNSLCSAFEEEEGFYQFADGSTAADIWFANPVNCGFYLLESEDEKEVVFCFGKEVFPEQEEEPGTVEVVTVIPRETSVY